MKTKVHQYSLRDTLQVMGYQWFFFSTRWHQVMFSDCHSTFPWINLSLPVVLSVSPHFTSFHLAFGYFITLWKIWLPLYNFFSHGAFLLGSKDLHMFLALTKFSCKGSLFSLLCASNLVSSVNKFSLGSCLQVTVSMKILSQTW